MALRVLLLVPVKWNIEPSLLAVNIRLAYALRGGALDRGVDVTVKHVFDGEGDRGIDPKRDATGIGEYNTLVFLKRKKALSRVRNRIIENQQLDEYTHVMWMDADVIDTSRYDLIPQMLFNHERSTIVAPMVILDRNQVFGDTWFYDTAGFVRKGNMALPFPPYFFPHDEESNKGEVEMDSVGTCYIVPAEVFKTARFQPHPTFTEHYPVCETARNLGMKVICNTDLRVTHGFLPNFMHNRAMEVCCPLHE